MWGGGERTPGFGLTLAGEKLDVSCAAEVKTASALAQLRTDAANPAQASQPRVVVRPFPTSSVIGPSGSFPAEGGPVLISEARGL